MRFEFRRWRFALRNLIAKDFRVRYRNMALGILWSVINPLVMLGILMFIFSYVHPSAGRPHFPVFLLLGLVGFNLFSRSVTQATVSVVENASLVKKVAFPRWLIPVAAIVSQLLDGMMMVGVLGAFILFSSVSLTTGILWLLPIYLVEVLFIFGVGLLVAALNVYYRDMRYLVESGLAILFWLTPIFYPLEAVYANLPRAVYGLYLLNPLAGCIHSARRVVLEASPPDGIALGVAAGTALAFCLVGAMAFRRLQRRFADYL